MPYTLCEGSHDYKNASPSRRFDVEHLSGIFMTADMNTKVPDMQDFVRFTDYLYGLHVIYEG